MVKKIFVMITIAFFIVSIVSCKKKESPPLIGNIAPDFTLRGINGNTTSLINHRGKVVMVEFWATWCSQCRELIPGLINLHEKYKDKGFTILGLVSETEREEDIRSFIKEYGITYQILFANKETIMQYGVNGLPVSFIINKEGRIVNLHLGNTPGIIQELAFEIEELL